MRSKWLPLTILSLVAIFLSGVFLLDIYQENRGDITQRIAEITSQLALPYHIAELSRQDEQEELGVPVYDVSLANVGDTWGAARAEGRTHEGTDIFAERGTPVFSATPGYVVRLNIGSLGGQNVMVVGPGGIRYYYAHFEDIAEGVRRGQRVTRDTVLGYVGNSGNATGTPPHLHFGIYPSEGSWDAVNPYPMLVDRW